MKKTAKVSRKTPPRDGSGNEIGQFLGALADEKAKRFFRDQPQDEVKRFWRVMHQDEVGRRWLGITIAMGIHAGLSYAEIGRWVHLSRWRVRQIARQLEAEISAEIEPELEEYIRETFTEMGIPFTDD
jgi:hypothetical protein